MSQDQLFMMNVQTQCCQFFKILIKKSGCFLQRVVCLVVTRAHLFTIGKTTIGKVKTKKRAMYKFKN